MQFQQTKYRHKASVEPQPGPKEKPAKVYSERGLKWVKMLKGKKYRTRDYMASTETINEPNGVTKAIYGIVSAFEQKHHPDNKWRGRHLRRPADVEKYFLWLYLTGSRANEPFLKPYPRINVMKPHNLPWKVIHIVRPIEKAFVPGTKERKLLEQYIPVFDAWENELWRKVLDDYDLTDLDDLFKRLETRSKNFNLTGIIQRNFRCDMREELTGKLVKGAPITPHALRHHRAYSLYIERGLDKDLVVSLFGWEDEKMAGYYGYINRGAKAKAQLQMLKRFASIKKEI